MFFEGFHKDVVGQLFGAASWTETYYAVQLQVDIGCTPHLHVVGHLRAIDHTPKLGELLFFCDKSTGPGRCASKI